jgi:phosphoglycolate phosphatase
VRPAGVVFDLDGTLVDSRLDLAAAVNATRERLALPPLAVEAVTGMVGEGAHVLLRRALPPAIDGPEFAAALALFLDLYYDRCLDATRAYPGIEELLAALARRHRLAVLTNKPERHSRRILDGLALLPRFDVVVGGDTLPVRKPDPGGLHHLAGRWLTTADRLLLVGDSGIDAVTAQAAGAALALVSWGFTDPARLDELGGWRVDRPSHLLARLR